MCGKEFAQGLGPVAVEDDLGVEIGVVDLAHEFAADAAGRQDVKLAGLFVSPDGDHLFDAVFALRDHRGQRTTFGAKAPTGGVDTDPGIDLAGAGDHHGTDVAKQAAGVV